MPGVSGGQVFSVGPLKLSTKSGAAITESSHSPSSTPVPQNEVHYNQERAWAFLASVAASAAPGSNGAALTDALWLPAEVWHASANYEELDAKSLRLLRERAQILRDVAAVPAGRGKDAAVRNIEKQLTSLYKHQPVPTPKFHFRNSNSKSEGNTDGEHVSRTLSFSSNGSLISRLRSRSSHLHMRSSSVTSIECPPSSSSSHTSVGKETRNGTPATTRNTIVHHNHHKRTNSNASTVSLGLVDRIRSVSFMSTAPSRRGSAASIVSSVFEGQDMTLTQAALSNYVDAVRRLADAVADEKFQTAHANLLSMIVSTLYPVLVDDILTLLQAHWIRRSAVRY